MTWLLAVTIGFFSLSALSWETPAARPIAESQIIKTPSEILIGVKQYKIMDTEYIGLYGARHKNFLTENLYWGEFGYGALSGKRSGYLEGGLMMGTHLPVFFGYFEPECLIFFGAGGGGSAPQGGGLLVNPVFAVSMPINERFEIGAEVGYIHFINGDISSITFGVSGTLNFLELGVRHEN